MQGGNVAGGLGLDREFFESILVPQVVIYGFLGLQPTVGGLKLNPRLPKDWAELGISRVHIHDRLVDIRVRGGAVEIRDSIPGGKTKEKSGMVVDLPNGWTLKGN